MRDSGGEMRKDLRADMGFEVRRALRASERGGIIKNALTQMNQCIRNESLSDVWLANNDDEGTC